MLDDKNLVRIYKEFNKQRDAVGFGPIPFELFMEAYRKGLINTSSIPFEVSRNLNNRKERRETWDFDGFNRPDEEDSIDYDLSPAGAVLRDLRQNGQTANAVWVDGRIVIRTDEEETYKFRDFAEAQEIINRFREGNKELKANVIKLKKENDYFRQRNEEQLRELEKLRAIVEAIEGLTTNTTRRPIQRGINDV